jgi:hypothetical protein
VNCPCCEDDYCTEFCDEEISYPPGYNFAGDTAGAVFYPRGKGPQYADRMRHAHAARARGVHGETIVVGLPLMDYFPVFTANRGGVTFAQAGR